MRRTISILVVMFIFASCAGTPQNSDNSSGESPEITLEEYSDHIMHYFENKNDLIIYETISIYKNKNYTGMLEQVDNIILFFFYGIKTDNIAKYNNFREIVRTHNLQRLINIFDVIDNNDIALFLRQQEPSPELNDIYWTLYFSSGNVQYIDYLLTIIMQYHNETENLNLYLVVRSAMWSIASNAMTYPQVRNYATNNRILNNELKRYILNTDLNIMRNETVEFIRQQREKGIW
ncbi:MAG: hypothetical protein LBI28_11825 [Treponema sp.]|nr:hypothetical protein [Treponema sp.]